MQFSHLHSCKNFAVWVLLFASLLLFPINPTRGQNCTPPKGLSPSQRALLAHIPPEMLAVLKTVREKSNKYCARADLNLTPQDLIDPLEQSSQPTPASLVEGTYLENEVIVTIAGDGNNIPQVAADWDLAEINRRRSDLLDAFLVRFAIQDTRTIRQVIDELTTDNRVDEVAPHHLYVLQFDKVEKARFAPAKVFLDRIKNNLTGKDIKIAIIDTAVDRNHPGLRDAVVETLNTMPDAPIEETGHGTAIAGLIASRHVIGGVARGANLFVARAFDKADGGKSTTTTALLIESLDWAVSKRVQIINMSFAGPRNTILSRATRAVSRRNILMVAAAGNNGPGAPSAYPGADPWVLAVTATDAQDRVYKFANTGNYVFISAPGVDVLVPAPNRRIDFVKGTSYAAAFVTGIAALMLDARPDLTPHDIANHMKTAARDLGEPGRDSTFGFGLVNAARAVGDEK